MRVGRAQKSLDTSRRAGYNIQVSSSLLACGFSSSGRASASQAEGGEFEPRNPLHSQRQDVCSGAFLFWGFTMLPPRGSVVRPLCRGCFGERVTSSDGCGQNRHEKTTVRRHRGDPSRFKAALFFFQRGNLFGRELPEFDRLSFPSFLPFQPSAFTFGHCGFGFVFFHGKITSRIFAGFSVERTLRGCFCQEETHVVLQICFLPFVWSRFCFLMGKPGSKTTGRMQDSQ